MTPEILRELAEVEIETIRCELARRIKSKRESEGLSLEVAGHQAGLGKNMMFRLENPSEIRYAQSTFVPMIQAKRWLGVGWSELLRESERPTCIADVSQAIMNWELDEQSRTLIRIVIETLERALK
jgi:hypothetical protein